MHDGSFTIAFLWLRWMSVDIHIALAMLSPYHAHVSLTQVIVPFERAPTRANATVAWGWGFGGRALDHLLVDLLPNTALPNHRYRASQLPKGG